MYAEAILKHTVQNNTMKTPAVHKIYSQTPWKIRPFLKPFEHVTTIDAKEDLLTKWMKKMIRFVKW